MIDDVRAREGRIVKVTPNGRSLVAETSQELNSTKVEATYRWMTFTTNELASLYAI